MAVPELAEPTAALSNPSAPSSMRRRKPAETMSTAASKKPPNASSSPRKRKLGSEIRNKEQMCNHFLDVCLVLILLGTLSRLAYSPWWFHAPSSGTGTGNNHNHDGMVPNAAASTASTWTSNSKVEPTEEAIASTLRHSRTLMGIFSALDDRNETMRRGWHRHMFEDVWKDLPEVCPLHFVRDPSVPDEQKEVCTLVYTFVVAHGDPEGPKERLGPNDTPHEPIEVKLPAPQNARNGTTDAYRPDMTRLNIAENMNEGKSQTWFYFGQKLIDELHEEFGFQMDYIMKNDGDSILRVDDYLEFARTRLPPHPYNHNVYVGALRNKRFWYENGLVTHKGKEAFQQYEQHFVKEYNEVHVYLAGECYVLSKDLAAFVAEEVPFARKRYKPPGYLEGIEDHDIASMVFHSATPVSMITVDVSQFYWEHPVKTQELFDQVRKKITRAHNDKAVRRKVTGRYIDNEPRPLWVMGQHNDNKAAREAHNQKREEALQRLGV